MFSFRSIDSVQLIRAKRWVFALLVIAMATLGPWATDLAAQAPISDRHVKKRVTLMNTNKAALAILSDMMAGRIVFDSAKARDARKALIQSTKSIPKRFRKARMDPNSHAKPAIWTHWDDFTFRAEAAEDAARQLNTRSLAGLRRTLPNMMQACLSCHQTYRRSPNEFITH